MHITLTPVPVGWKIASATKTKSHTLGFVYRDDPTTIHVAHLDAFDTLVRRGITQRSLSNFKAPLAAPLSTLFPEDFTNGTPQ